MQILEGVFVKKKINEQKKHQARKPSISKKKGLTKGNKACKKGTSGREQVKGTS